MNIERTGMAGSLESSDVLVTVDPRHGGVEIVLKSIAEARFGKQIRSLITATLEELSVTEARVQVEDRSALDCTIKARLVAAIHRAAKVDHPDWGKLS